MSNPDFEADGNSNGLAESVSSITHVTVLNVYGSSIVRTKVSYY